MTEISRTALFGKLNSLAYRAIDSATTFCKLRGNPYVELEHWLHQILQLQDSDLHHIIRHFELNPSVVAKDMTSALDRLPRGASSSIELSSHVEEAVERGWVYSTLLFGESQVRTGHLLVGIWKTRSLRHAVESISNEFGKINLDTLTGQFGKLTGGSPEERLTATDGTKLGAGMPGAVGDETMAAAALGKQEALLQFSQDLTERARKGEIDPVVGRNDEIRQIVDILMRRRQNNPILTGEAGVGKTAVVEGFAYRIAQGDVPPPLLNVTLRALDVGLLQAGASFKGEFEKRLRQVIDEVQSSEKPIILFIDEAHTLIGAGGAAGTGDAANLLKPALARGTLRTIAATTWAEYKKYFEKDA
ncbi:MAG: AAA family ATPase, partial [Syntrophobacterales bacterium]